MSEEFMNYMNNHLVIGGAEVGTNSAEEEVENKAEELEPLPQEINIELPDKDDAEPESDDAEQPTEDEVEETDDEPQEVVTEKIDAPMSFNCLVVMPAGSADAILDEMQRRAKDDESIANGLADKSKSIKGCVDYICNQMRKFASKGNSSLMVKNEEVFGLAVHYYTETNEMLGISKSTPKAEPKPKAEKPKKDKVTPLNPKATTPKKEKKQETMELSLF